MFMPSQPIVFPANFTTASAMAYTGADGAVQLVTQENPIPVSLSGGAAGSGLTDDELRASPVSVSLATFAGVTDSQLRAAPVPVNLASYAGLTDEQLRAAPVPVSLPSFAGLTNAELRATPVTVSLSAFSGLTDTQLRASPVSVSLASFGGITDTQLRASPVSVSLSSFGGLTDAQLRASAVSVSPDAVADALRTSGTATSAAVLVSVPTTGYCGGSFHVTGAGTTCTITYEQSNDNATWVALPVVSLASATATPALTTTAAGIYGFTTSAAYVRARVSTYGSGTVAVTLSQKRQSAPTTSVSVSGITNVGSGFTDSTTALTGSATFTGTGRATSAASGHAFFHAVAYADQSGTLFIDLSLDSGATYQPVASQAVTASAPAQLTAKMTGNFGTATLYRVRYVNGTTAQTTFRLSSAFSR